MLSVGLLFSYSRGAWVGTAVGLLYLARAHTRFRWRFVMPGFLAVAAVAWFFWQATSNTDPWYVKRLDLSRPSSQHRIAAWKAAVRMMWDYPLGVGWNEAIETYEKHYSPPEGGAAALTTNDYMMLGTQLGLPGLSCFLVYIALSLRAPSSCLQAGTKARHPGESLAPIGTTIACRAGALALAVAFWFDDGLFKLATASVFWILLELGAAELPPRGAKGAKTEVTT